MAELQFNLQRPEDETGGDKIKTKSGCIFMDIARPKGDGSDRMDWENKITMKLNSRDIAMLVQGLRSEECRAELIHKVEKDEGSSVTSLKVIPGDHPDTYQWSIFKSVGTDKKSASIYLDKYDMYLTFKMLETAIPVIHGWID